MGLFSPNIEKLKKKRDFPALVLCMKHRRALVRYRAFLALAHMPDLPDEVIDKMKTRLYDPDEGVRTVATLKFAELGEDLRAENLRELISNGAKKDKIDLLKIIASRGSSVDDVILEAIVLALTDRKPIVRLEAVKTAGAVKSSHLVPNLAPFLRSRHAAVRIELALALGKIADERCVDYLIGLLADVDPLVREKARVCLDSIDSARVRRALNDSRFIQLIAGMGGREPDRRDTARRIGVEGISEALPLLNAACGDRFKEVRIEVLRSIAMFRDPSSTDCAARLLKDKYYDVRIEAMRALAGIGGEDSLKALQIALHDKNKKIREEAQRIISSYTQS